MNAHDPRDITAASQRIAAHAALRQIRHIVDAEQANDLLKATWTRRFSALFFVTGVIAVSWTLFHLIK